MFYVGLNSFLSQKKEKEIGPIKTEISSVSYWALVHYLSLYTYSSSIFFYYFFQQTATALNGSPCSSHREAARASAL